MRDPVDNSLWISQKKRAEALTEGSVIKRE